MDTRTYHWSRKAPPLLPGAAIGLDLATAAAPEPGPGQILVRVRASALNFIDLTLVDGRMPGIDGRVPLLDGAGEVVAVGPGVSRWSPGDRVVANPHQNWLAGEPRPETSGAVLGCVIDGMLREHAILPETGVARIPEGLGFEAAASLPCAGLSAWNSVFGGPTAHGCRPGDTVLVQGTGGVALFGLQLAKVAGCRVIATTSSPEKAALLEGMGADAVIDYRANPDWAPAVLELTHGQGVDLVIDIAGAATIGQSLQAVRTGGRVALIGMVGGMGSVDYAALLPVTLKTLTVFGNGMGSLADLEAMLRLVAFHGIQPHIDRVFPFDEAVEAFTHFAGRGHIGKVVIGH